MGEIKDFSRDREDVKFKIDGDVFEAKKAIPAKVLMNFAKKFSDMDSGASVEQQLEAFEGVLTLVLVPRSLELFQSRMADDDNPIDVEQVEEIITWLFERYGMRPTQLPAPSSDGPPSPESGTSSTGTTPAVVSTFSA
jgi:hypothetical protein